MIARQSRLCAALAVKVVLILAIGIAGQYAQEPSITETRAPIPPWGRHVVEVIGLKQGDTIADIGAGKGTWLPVWSAVVGSTGHVIAEDIDKRSLDRARRAAEEQKLMNVEFVLGTSSDPVLPDRCADLIVVMDAYHEFEHPAEMLAHISRTLKDRGRLAVIDFYRPDKVKAGVPPPWHIRLDKNDALHEIESHGFRLLSVEDHLGGKQYIAMFVNSESVP